MLKDDYEMTLLLGGTASSSIIKLEEHTPSTFSKECDSIVECDLNGPASYSMAVEECDPFGEEFTQNWNVTPIEVKLTNHSTAYDCTVYLFIDGKKDTKSHHLCVGETKIVRGFTNPDKSVHEILFSRPRLLKVGEDIQEPTEEEKFECGSIRADFFTVTHKTTTTTTKSNNNHRNISSDFDGPNKKLALKAGAGATSRPGKILKVAASKKTSSTKGAKNKNKMTTLWHKDQSSRTTIRTRYQMKHHMISDQVIPRESETKKNTNDERKPEVIDLC